jgi:chemotaxis signal transduction protein
MSDVVVVDVGERRVAIPSSQAREVAAAGWVTPVPTAPPLVAGVMQLRGQVLPVLDLGPAARPVRPEDSLLIVEYGPARAALRVLELLPADTPAERLDLGAIFDSIRAAT